MSNFANTVMDTISSLLRVPVRSSNAAKVEHALALFVGYLAIRKVVDVGPRELVSSFVATAMRYARKMPGVSGAVAKEQAEILDKIKAMVLGGAKDNDEPPNRALPAEGVPYVCLSCVSAPAHAQPCFNAYHCVVQRR